MWNIDNSKSYATVDNLTKALLKLKIDHHPHLKVRNTTGRWTAIFPSSNYQNDHCFKGGMCYIAYYASLGFFTLG